MGISFSILLIAAGAIRRWAVTVTIAGVNLQTVGLILFVVSILGVLLSLAFWNRLGRIPNGVAPSQQPPGQLNQAAHDYRKESPCTSEADFSSLSSSSC